MPGTTNNPVGLESAPADTAVEHLEQRLLVGIANFKVSDDHSLIFTADNLGSCVAVAFYDPIVEVAGLLHAMLPQSDLSPTLASSRPGMFLDTGIQAMLDAAMELEANKHRMLVYLIGGAHIMDESTLFNVGRNNHRVAAELLSRHDLRIRAQDVGGMNNRSVSLAVATGQLIVKISGQDKEYRL